MCRLFSKQDEHFGDFNFTRLYNKSSFIFTHSSYPTTKAVHISNTNRLLLILLIIDLIYCSSFFVDPASLLLVSFFSFFLLKIASKLLAYLPPPPHPDSAGLNAILWVIYWFFMFVVVLQKMIKNSVFKLLYYISCRSKSNREVRKGNNIIYTHLLCRMQPWILWHVSRHENSRLLS